MSGMSGNRRNLPRRLTFGDGHSRMAVRDTIVQWRRNRCSDRSVPLRKLFGVGHGLSILTTTVRSWSRLATVYIWGFRCFIPLCIRIKGKSRVVSTRWNRDVALELSSFHVGERIPVWGNMGVRRIGSNHSLSRWGFRWCAICSSIRLVISLVVPLSINVVPPTSRRSRKGIFDSFFLLLFFFFARVLLEEQRIMLLSRPVFRWRRLRILRSSACVYETRLLRSNVTAESDCAGLSMILFSIKLFSR